MVENQLGFLFSQIAESIRGGLGNIGTLKPNAFPAKIDDIVALIGSGGGESGSGGALTFASGSFSPGTDGERVTVTHGLGVMPDLVIVQLSNFLSFTTYEEAAESQAFTAAWGMRSALGSGQHSGLLETICGLSSTYGIDNMPDKEQGYGYIFCPDENTFQVGCDGKQIWQLYAGDSYQWIAVSGIGGGVSQPVIEPLEVTENGTYTPPEGVDGYSPVTVAVPAPQIKLQEKTATVNGTYTADAGFDGLAKVLVNVAASGGTVVAKKGTFTGNGSYVTFNHNLGVVPSVIFCYPSTGITGMSSDNIGFAIGMNQETASKMGLTVDQQYGLIWNSYAKDWGQNTPDYPIESASSSSSLMLFSDATATSIRVGSSMYKTKNATGYTWFAFGIQKD